MLLTGCVDPLLQIEVPVSSVNFRWHLQTASTKMTPPAVAMMMIVMTEVSDTGQEGHAHTPHSGGSGKILL